MTAAAGWLPDGIGGLVALGLLIYLLIALVRPERF